MIELKSRQMLVKAVKKKTTAKGFNTFRAGDILQFTVELKRQYRSSHGCSAALVKVTNLTTEVAVVKSFTEVQPILRCFELVEADDAMEGVC